MDSPQRSPLAASMTAHNLLIAASTDVMTHSLFFVCGQGWSAFTSADGDTFYHNSASGELSWDKPECMMTDEEREKELGGSWIWVAHKEEVWLPARVTGRSGGKPVVQILRKSPHFTATGYEYGIWPGMLILASA